MNAERTRLGESFLGKACLLVVVDVFTPGTTDSDDLLERDDFKVKIFNRESFLASNLLCLRRTALIGKPFHTDRSGLSGFVCAPNDVV